MAGNLFAVRIRNVHSTLKVNHLPVRLFVLRFKMPDFVPVHGLVGCFAFSVKLSLLEPFEPYHRLLRSKR